MESHTSAGSLSRDSWTLLQPPLPSSPLRAIVKDYKAMKPESRAAAAAHNTQTVPLQAQGCLCLQGSQQEHGLFTGFGAATGKNDLENQESRETPQQRQLSFRNVPQLQHCLGKKESRNK